MAAHSRIFAWKIPWTEESGGPNPQGHKESDTSDRSHTRTGEVPHATHSGKKKKKFRFLSWPRLLLSLSVWWELPLQHTPVTSSLQVDLFWMESISLFSTVKKQ